jgi:hypothetical protein
MLLAFEKPPPSVPLLPKRRLPECSWAAYPTIEGKPSTDIVKELIKRSLDVACFRAGLAWCEDRQTLYFPHTTGPQRNVSYRHVDGRNTWVGVTGERSYGHGDRAVPFRYQLGPSFRVGQDEAGVWWVTTRIYVRITDCDGLPLEGKAIGRRRKTVIGVWLSGAASLDLPLLWRVREASTGAGRRETRLTMKRELGNNDYMGAKPKTYKTLTPALLDAIRESGKSFKALERETGVLRQSLMKFVRGETSLRLDIADRLAEYFGFEITGRKAK